MNTIEERIKRMTHLAAQKVLNDLAKDHSFTYRKQDQFMWVRKHTLDLLVEYGYDRFLLDKNEPEYIEPIYSGHTKTEESWCAWAIYSKAEVSAWLKAFESTLLSFDIISEDKKSCSRCGGYLETSRYDVMRCVECKEEYMTQDQYNHNLAKKITGWTSYNNGVGRGFADHAYIRESRSRYLIKWNGGLDI